MITLSVTSCRPFSSSGLKRPAARRDCSMHSVSNSPGRWYWWIIDFISVAYCPALPSTSTITPRARYFSVGYESISTTTLSFSLAPFAPTSSTVIGSKKLLPSGSTSHDLGCLTRVPTNLFCARSRISIISPLQRISPPRLPLRLTFAKTMSPVIASALADGDMNKSPCELGSRGVIKPNPFGLALNVPTI